MTKPQAKGSGKASVGARRTWARPDAAGGAMEVEDRLKSRMEEIVARLQAFGGTGASPPEPVLRATAVLIRDQAQVLRHVVDLLAAPAYRGALLARPALTQRWPLVAWVDGPDGWDTVIRICAGAQGDDGRLLSLFAPWPVEMAPLDAARFAVEALGRADGEARAFADDWLDVVQTGRFDFRSAERKNQQAVPGLLRQLPDGRRFWLRYEEIALVAAVHRQIEDDLQRHVIHIDASKPHHDMVRGISRAPRQADGRLDVVKHDQRYELLMKGEPVQLSLPVQALDDVSATPHAVTVKVLRQLMGPEGLRVWAAMLRLLSVEGGRRGFVRWMMSDLLDAMGYGARIRENALRLAEIASHVELLTRLELAAVDANGKLRERRPLFMVGARYERLEGSQWKLDGVELQINPLLYSGVRNTETGRLGNDFFPIPTAVAQIDHIRHPSALVLGLILPIRFRWRMGEKESRLILSGEALLELASIELNAKNPLRGWTALERDLGELVRVEFLGEWRWLDAPRQLASRVELVSAPWLLDRALRGLHAEERPPAELPRSGRELREWRLREGHSQEAMASVLDLGRQTIIRAEDAEGEVLTPAMQRALQVYVARRLRSLRTRGAKAATIGGDTGHEGTREEPDTG